MPKVFSVKGVFLIKVMVELFAAFVVLRDFISRKQLVIEQTWPHG